MLNYLEFLNAPTKIGIVIVAVLLVIQFIGEILEFKGKIVPEFMKFRKYFARKRQERKTLKELPRTFEKIETLLNDVGEHYGKDNISKRDKWINWVNNQAKIYDVSIAELEKKIDKNNEITLLLLIDNKRNAIIDFASKVVDENYPATREQFNRVFKIYKEYEDIIEENEMTNGEVDVAIRIIRESYEKHMKHHSFIENIRGYD